MSTINGGYVYRGSRALIDINAEIEAERHGAAADAWVIEFSCSHATRAKDRPHNKSRFKKCPQCGVRRGISSVRPAPASPGAGP